MSAVRQRASLFATRGVIVAFVASILVFVTPRTLAIGSAIVTGVTLVVVFIAVSTWVFTTRPGMSYFALGPTDHTGRAKENTVDHVAAQIAAILLAFMAVLGWMVWIAVTAAEAASFDTSVSRAETAQTLVLQGTLVDKAGRPVAGRTIFTFPITDNGQVIRFPGISPDGRLLAIERAAHPHARTDANGRFRIAYGKVTAVDLSGDRLVLTGTQHPGVTIGVFRRENLRTATPETENPLMLVPAPGTLKPTITTRGNSIVVQLGTLTLPGKASVR